MKTVTYRVAAAVAILLATTAGLQAHPSETIGAGFVPGLQHPFGGLDHILAMVGVGVWAAQIGGRAQWAIPAAFIAAMVGGGLLGVSGVPLPLVETGIAGSVVLLGIMIAGGVRPMLSVGVAVAGLFAVFHGFAHGAEAPASVTPLLYGLGFVVATALLHAGGFIFMRWLRAFGVPAWPRLVGGTISVLGLALFAGA